MPKAPEKQGLMLSGSSCCGSMQQSSVHPTGVELDSASPLWGNHLRQPPNLSESITESLLTNNADSRFLLIVQSWVQLPEDTKDILFKVAEGALFVLRDGDESSSVARRETLPESEASSSEQGFP